MKFLKLSDVGSRGWFIGDYPEALIQTDKFEVCYDEVERLSCEPHYHTKCREIVLITEGIVMAGNRECRKGDIIIFEKGDINDIIGITDYKVVVVKVPAGGNDKIIV
jgi:uncharacterized cupin superfamily protein